MNPKEDCAEVVCLQDVKNDQHKVTKNNEFIFESRESLLTPHFRSQSDLRAVYNWVLGIFIVYLLCHLINYVINPRDLETDINLLKNGFRNFEIVILLEFFYALWSIFQWILARSRVKIKPCLLFFIQFIMVTIYIVIPIAGRLQYDMSFAIGIIIPIEQIRVSMKVYSLWTESKNDQGKQATFSQFVYFWFAPTLLYRSSYPRAKRRSYLKCMIYILECLACIFVAGVLVRRNLFDGIWSPENHPIRINNVPKTFFELYLASACLMVLFWYLFFHCWFNAWAEALRFGDRYFYGPWWLIKFENKIHRHWNPLVHQWLKCYIYSPIRKKIGRKGAFTVTIIISAIAHEYCLSYASGFLIIWVSFFLLSCLPIFLKRKSIRLINWKNFSNSRNVLALVMNSLFYALILLYISLESYYRANCSTIQKQNQIMNFILPKLPDCIEFGWDSEVKSSVS